MELWGDLKLIGVGLGLEHGKFFLSKIKIRIKFMEIMFSQIILFSEL